MRELLIKGLFDDHDHECGIIRRRKMTKPAPFLFKTYMLVDDTSTDDMLSWAEDGTTFVVWQPAEFARDLLPTLFKHSNFSSFVRQLNTYGFRKVTTTRWEFQNDMFRKNKQELLVGIRRRKTWRNSRRSLAATANLHTGSDIRSSSTTSSSSELNYLIDENKKLKKENGVLCSELNAMKRKCQELFRLVALFGDEVDEDGDSDGDDGNNKNRPKLFGVRLDLQDESERKRRKKLALDYTRTL